MSLWTDGGCVGLKTFDHSPLAYAKRLASYINCATTVRARTIDEFGYAPSLTHIEGMIQRRREKSRQADNDDMPEAEGPRFLVPKLANVNLAVRRTPREVITGIAKEFGVTYEQMIQKDRRPRICRIRNICAYVLKERGNSYPMVGKFLGGRDHSTIINAYRNFLSEANDKHRRIAAQFIEDRPC